MDLNSGNMQTNASANRVSATATRHVHTRAVSTPTLLQRKRTGTSAERQPLIRRRHSLSEQNDIEDGSEGAVAGGTVLGIHNLAIVLPQFFVSII